ncbi:hypothetical protein [Porticoccus sp.]
MTLAIAAIEENTVWIMADTKYTFDEIKSGKKPVYGLKVFFLDKYTAIAYATDVAVEIAHQRIYDIYRRFDSANFGELVERIYCDFDQAIDFILARSGGSPAIAKISDGYYAIENNQGIYWVGSQAAAQFTVTSNITGFGELKNRLDEIITGSCFPEVGGHAVAAKGDTCGFKFMPIMQLTSPLLASISKSWQPIDFGSAQTGGFGYTTVTPKDPGVNGWGVFYFQGFYGEYWHVDLRRNIFERLVGKARDASAFAAQLEADIGHNVEIVGSLG